MISRAAGLLFRTNINRVQELHTTNEHTGQPPMAIDIHELLDNDQVYPGADIRKGPASKPLDKYNPKGYTILLRECEYLKIKNLIGGRKRWR